MSLLKVCHHLLHIREKRKGRRELEGRKGGKRQEKEGKNVQREKRENASVGMKILLLKSLDVFCFFKNCCFVSLYNLESLKWTDLP